VWITGAGGLIGSHLFRVAAEAAPDLRPVPLTRGALDLTDSKAVRERFRAEGPAVIIHCAGLTRSPACEADPELAHRLNAEVTGFLAELATASGAVLVFFSSDLVFDGTKGWYREEDAPRPLSAYGRSKVAGEEAVLRDSRHMVLRTSLNYGHSPTGDRAFNEELVRAAERGAAPIALFTDEFRCPLAAEVTARATWHLVRAALTPPRSSAPRGILHVAGSERLSRWEIGELLARAYPALRGRLRPASRREYSGPPRPADTSLDCRKIAQFLGGPLPGFSKWLVAHPANVV
jgi:dTDP-4-dehydrorhamnose reductase